jgi:hypothetical protein
MAKSFTHLAALNSPYLGRRALPTFTREKAYELAWSEPMRDLAKRFGLSDVGLKKALQKADIPLPPQGHWNLVHAGKAVLRIELPPRGPGMPESISFGESNHPSWPYDPAKVLGEPLPVEPIFAEPLEEVRERMAKQVGKCSVSRDLSSIHPSIQRLLAKDDTRREDYNRWKSAYYAPYFDSPFEQRRLLVLNNILLALARHNVKADCGGQKGRDLTAQVGVERVSFRLDHPTAKKNQLGEWEVRSGKIDSLKLALGDEINAAGQPNWEDLQGAKFGAQLGEIVVAITLRGEEQYRSRAVARHRWELDQRARAEAELKRRCEEARRIECERLLKLEREARESLLRQAEASRRASDIRAFVAAVEQKTQSSGGTLATAASEWSAWARRIADRLDPLTNVGLVDGQIFFGSGDGSDRP